MIVTRPLQRVEGHPEEARMWYTNYEGVALRPREWLQRHIGCRLQPDEVEMIHTLPWRRTCEAVVRAMGWYYGRGAHVGKPDPLDRYWGMAVISVLGPGQHVRPHTGPRNERVVISL